VHVAVTNHATSAWTAQQLRTTFPNDGCPFYLLHDRDAVFAGVAVTIAAMQIQERFIGSTRRECLDHVIVMSAAGLHVVKATSVPEG
jgi:putative transposase